MDTIAGSFYRKKKLLNVTSDNYKEREKELFRIRIYRIDSTQIFKWCDERFGDEWIWSTPMQTEYTDIFFLNEADALVFRLAFVTA